MPLKKFLRKVFFIAFKKAHYVLLSYLAILLVFVLIGLVMFFIPNIIVIVLGLVMALALFVLARIFLISIIRNFV